MARPEFDIVVIGGGSAGLVVAAGGAQLGARVALIEKHRMGGDCLNTGCVPSKTLIHCARVARTMRTAGRYGIPPASPQIQLAEVMERVAEVIREIEPHDSAERFRGLGVEVILGEARFVDGETIAVGSRRLSARSFVIATGSRAAIPPIPGIDAVPVLTNETVFTLREDVPRLLVIGAGPIGCELAQAFRRLGSEVTIVDVAPGVLPREDRDLGDVVERALRDEGIVLHLRSSVASVAGTHGDIRMRVRGHDGRESALAGSHLLVAAGRTIYADGLDLDRAGVAVAGGRIVADRHLRTTNPRVFVAGDAAGSYQFTHVASHHAGIVLRQALFRMRWAKPSTVIPWCTYTDPQLARVGLSEAEARAQGIAHEVWRFPFADLDRARTDGDTEGFAKILTGPRGRLLGAAIVGAHAGELIHEYVLALAKGMKASDISGVIHVYPTFAEINKRVADERLKAGLTPTTKRWIHRIFGLQGH